MVENICRFSNDKYVHYVIVFCNTSHQHNISKYSKVIFCSNTYFRRRLILPNILKLSQYNSIIKILNPDIIHSHTYFTDLIMLNGFKGTAILFAHLHLERLVLNPKLNDLNVKKLISNYFDKLWYQNLLNKFKATLISISDYSTEYHKSCLPKALHPKIITIKNAIDLPTPCYRLPIKQQIVKMVSVGRLEPEKNHFFLLYVMKYLMDVCGNVNFRLDIFGEGSLKSKLENEIERLKLNNIVTLKGNVDNINLYLSDYYLYLHSSKREQFGLTILEAMNFSLPCIGLDYGAVGELIIDGKTGSLIKEEIPSLYAAKILKIVNDRLLYSSLSSNAFTFSLDYSFEHYMVTLNKVYLKS